MWEVLDRLQLLAVHDTGSRYICDPPVMDTDWDKVALVSDPMFQLTLSILVEDGWALSRTYGGLNPGFRAARKGQANLIMTTSYDFFNRFLAATLLSKYLALNDKEVRINMFKSVLGSEELENITYAPEPMLAVRPAGQEIQWSRFVPLECAAPPRPSLAQPDRVLRFPVEMWMDEARYPPVTATAAYEEATAVTRGMAMQYADEERRTMGASIGYSTTELDNDF
jgi:hypothetical protein